jgi:nitrate/nitrite transporter NarK
VLASIIFAGEIVFSLPFHIARFFRPTFLEVFALSNTQLGDIFAVYGVIAMLAYFPGGLIADKFQPRKLMALSLLATALGGVYLYSIPNASGLAVLFGYWGLTSILLFWGAMIKVTRQWGASNAQGLAFGLLDGGRGFVASLFASAAVLILSFSTRADTGSGLEQVILFYTLVTILAAAVIWFALPRSDFNIDPSSYSSSDSSSHSGIERIHIIETLKNPNVWIQGGIVIAAYCGYKALDNYGIYAVDVLGMTQLESAEFTTLASYSRPIAAIAAGLIVDRFSASAVIKILFTALLAAFVMLAAFNPSADLSAIPSAPLVWFVMTNLLITFIAVYALRGVYFALLEESNIKLHSTGTAVGIISVLGFTPDIFFAPITGRILDANPGFVGFQHYFLTLAVVSVIGLIFSSVLVKRASKTKI